MFDGETYVSERDKKRLLQQIDRIRKFMVSPSGWKTLGEIEKNTGEPQASISAQLRNLRKKNFGAWVLEKRIRNGSNTWEYRLRCPGYQSAYVQEKKSNKLNRVLRLVYRHVDTTEDLRKAVKKIMEG